MKTAATSLDATRHRLLEGVLLRLAWRPEPAQFVLRGGMLLRHWLRPVPRPSASDSRAWFASGSPRAMKLKWTVRAGGVSRR